MRVIIVKDDTKPSGYQLALITTDLTAVTYCDSAAIHALFTAAGHSRLTLIVPETGPITTMLKIAGLDQITTVITPH